MIIHYILKVIILIGTWLQTAFGRVDVLPFGIDTPIVHYWGMFLYIVDEFWPLQGILTIVGIYLGWRLSIMLYKKIFGSRAVIN